MYRFGSFLSSAMARLSPTATGEPSSEEQDATAAAIEAEILRNQQQQQQLNNESSPISSSSSPSSASGMSSPFPRVSSGVLDISQLEQFAQNTLEEFLNSVDQSQRWTFLAKEEDVNISTHKPAGQTRECIKGEGIIKSDPSILLDEIWDPEVKYRKQWDEMLSEAFIVEQVSDTLQISYTSFRSPTRLVASRDFVVLRKLVLHDQSGDLAKGFVMVFKSFEFDHPICTPKKDLVRGDTLASGFLVTPLSDNPMQDGFAVKCVLDVDVKGWLPDIVVNFFNAKQATVIAKIRNRCQRRTAAKLQQVQMYNQQQQ